MTSGFLFYSDLACQIQEFLYYVEALGVML